LREQIALSYGEGRLRVHIHATLTVDGAAVILTGGERPHVGGMAMSVPRAHTGRPETWITPRPGHRDSDVATLVAELLCRETGCCTAVIAGIHIDQATREEIDLLVENSQEAARRLGDKIKQIWETEHA
jgi:hypothetical protein